MKKTILLALCMMLCVAAIVGCRVEKAAVVPTAENPESPPPKEEIITAEDEPDEPKELKPMETEPEANEEPESKEEPRPERTKSTVKAEPIQPPIETPKAEDKPKQPPKETAEPSVEATPETVPEETPKPTPEPTPVPTPEPPAEPQMEVMGGSFNKAVLAGVNEVRAQNGNAPLKLDSGLCAKALAHAKEMAARGETFHSCGGAESVTGSTAGGKSIGIRSAGHATGLALDADRSRLGVGSVKIGDKQYTCVFAPRD